MSNIIRLIVCVVTYMILFGSAVYTLAEPVYAGDYLGNFKKVPAIENRPAKVAAWNRAPTIVVCTLAPISEIQIKSAVQFWNGLGHDFDHIYYKDNTGTDLNTEDICQSEQPKGYIVIHLATQGVKMDASSLAQTRFYVDNNINNIEWAIIYMRQDLRPMVLEHELGHALGFLHYNHINHLMHEKWTMGGWNKEGLENSRR